MTLGLDVCCPCDTGCCRNVVCSFVGPSLTKGDPGAYEFNDDDYELVSGEVEVESNGRIWLTDAVLRPTYKFGRREAFGMSLLLNDLESEEGTLKLETGKLEDDDTFAPDNELTVDYAGRSMDYNGTTRNLPTNSAQDPFHSTMRLEVFPDHSLGDASVHAADFDIPNRAPVQNYGGLVVDRTAYDGPLAETDWQITTTGRVLLIGVNIRSLEVCFGTATSDAYDDEEGTIADFELIQRDLVISDHPAGSPVFCRYTIEVEGDLSATECRVEIGLALRTLWTFGEQTGTGEQTITVEVDDPGGIPDARGLHRILLQNLAAEDVTYKSAYAEVLTENGLILECSRNNNFSASWDYWSTLPDPVEFGELSPTPLIDVVVSGLDASRFPPLAGSYPVWARYGSFWNGGGPGFEPQDDYDFANGPVQYSQRWLKWDQPPWTIIEPNSFPSTEIELWIEYRREAPRWFQKYPLPFTAGRISYGGVGSQPGDKSYGETQVEGTEAIPPGFTVTAIINPDEPPENQSRASWTYPNA